MNYHEKIKAAVKYYWDTRNNQAVRQGVNGNRDQGARSAVTGGKQMSKFEALAREIAIISGIPDECIFADSNLELPGFFRPEKKWDFLIVWEETLVCALEFKSQVGPSFGNNFNNRTEEAIGTATDLWVAFRENAFGSELRPFLGYFFLLEDCPKSTTPVGVREPHFNVFPEFKNASYFKRYNAFLNRLKRERLYDSVGLALSPNGSPTYKTEAGLDPTDLFLDLESHLKNTVRKMKNGKSI